MTDLYARILLWHKLVAMQTGGLALCSAKHRLNRAEAAGWVTALRNVSDDIQTFLDTGEFILDSKGQREVKSAGEDRVGPNGKAPKETRHEPTGEGPVTAETPSPGKIGSLRVATRKKQ